MKNRKIRILVLGDDQVGKTSWVNSLVSDNQPEIIPHVIDPVVFTEMFVHTFQVSTVLIDTARDILGQPDRFQDEVKSAQVILLVYDLANASTIDSMTQTWLPRIEKENNQVPVLIIGNKRDMLDEIQNQDRIAEDHRIEKVIVPLMKTFRQVQMGFECSAMYSQYISDVIYAAHVAVLFPLSPLYDISSKTLTIPFERALSRIFRLCDKDNDFQWTDEELRDFQQEVFQADLTGNDIQGIKQLIREELSQSIDGRLQQQQPRLQDSGINKQALISFEGFKLLQKKCVELIKMQICWAILRHFNYDDKLDLDRKLFKDSLTMNKDSGQTVELNGKANQFLIQRCFKRFGISKAVKQGGRESTETVLLKSSLQTLFFPYSKKGEDLNGPAHPFADILGVVSSPDCEYILQEEWLCLWAYKTREDYLEVYRILVYIGYTAKLEETFLITNPTNCLSSIQKMASRYVYNVCLVGIQDSQSDLRSILGRYQNQENSISINNDMNVAPITQPIDYATQIRFENGRKKIIVFTFVNQFHVDELLTEDHDHNITKRKKFDSIGIVYHESSELAKFVQQKDSLPKFMEIPKLFLQISPVSTDRPSDNLKAYTREYLRFNSAAEFEQARLNAAIFNLIEKPTKGLHKTYIKIIRDKDPFLRKNLRSILITGGISTMIGLFYFAHKSTFKNVVSSIRKALRI